MAKKPVRKKTVRKKVTKRKQMPITVSTGNPLINPYAKAQPWQAYTPSALTPPRTRDSKWLTNYKKRMRKAEMKRKSLKVHGFTPFTEKEIAQLDPHLKQDERYLKKWIRLDTSHVGTRVWKKATFLSSEIFGTRMTQKSGACLYHICMESKKHIMYTKLPKTEQVLQCPECEGEISKSIYSLMMLQKLRQ